LRVLVVVPFRGGCPHRERAWRWLRERYAAIHPGWDLVEAPAPEGEWCKAAAVNPVVEASGAEVVIVADADVWCDEFERAAMAVVCGQASWAMPHKMVHRLDEVGSAAVLAGESWKGQPLAQKPYEGVWGGGIVVAERAVLLDSPLDPRFRGWGQEDTSWALALRTLHGPGWRGDAPLVHLWHPPQSRMNRLRGSHEGWELHCRYRQARGKPVVMRALVEEFKEEIAWA